MSDGPNAESFPLTVLEMINLAAVIASANARALHERWIKAQFSLSDMPASMHTAFSHIINLDLLLRQLERERQPAEGCRNEMFILGDQIFYAISDAWISQVYEVLRVVSNRAKVRGARLSPDLEAVKHAAGLVRMGVNKGEVAEMHTKRNQADIQIQLQNTDGEIVPDYVNDGSWIMPRGERTDSGSCMWWCIDVSTGAPRTIEVCRQEISDQLLEAMIAAREAHSG